MKLLSLTILSLLMMTNCQDEHPIFKKHADIIKSAKEISLAEIASNPTSPEAKDSSKTYLYDYEVMSSDSISENVAEELKKAILQTENYVIDAKKNCPMTAKYALTFSKKKKHTMTFILSGNTCEKVIIKSSEKDFEPMYLDLKEKSEILALINQIKMP